MDVFYGCLGVAAIILALGAVYAIPSVLGMIERVAMADKPQAPRGPSPTRPDAPWGERR